MRALRELVGPFLAVVGALVVGALFIAVVGEDPLAIYGRWSPACSATRYGIGQVALQATPLVFTGLAVALGFRAGLFNIGAEGQCVVAAFAVALVGAAFADLPAIVLLPLCIVAAMAAGALWALPPGLLKARFGAHEVINTIMLNFIALALVQYLGHAAFVHATVRTSEIGAGARIPRLEAVLPFFRGSPVNGSVVLAALAAGFVGWLLWRTRSATSCAPSACSPPPPSTAGIPVPRMRVLALCLSGALAGLVGTNFVLGYKDFFEIGLLGRRRLPRHRRGAARAATIRPASSLAALFFGALSYGGLVINTDVPKELVEILQAIVILFAITLHVAIERRARRRAA